MNYERPMHYRVTNWVRCRLETNQAIGGPDEYSTEATSLQDLALPDGDLDHLVRFHFSLFRVDLLTGRSH
jgi:hypothetical protein